MTIENLIKNMTDEEKIRFLEGFTKELEFWGNIIKVENKETNH